MNEIERIIIDRITELLDLVQIDGLEFKIGKNKMIEAIAFNIKDGTQTCLIKIEVSESNKEIYIPNIILPDEMKYMGLGKRMICLIFMVGDHFGYSVYLIMLTDSFRQKMIERGALQTSQHDVLQIVKQTDLSSKNDRNNPIYLG